MVAARLPLGRPPEPRGVNRWAPGTEPGLQAALRYSPHALHGQAVYVADCHLCHAYPADAPEHGAMGETLEVYMHHLSRQDLAPSSRARYKQIAQAYCSWLGNREPSVDTALDFIAGLRDRDYADNTLNLYKHVVRSLHRALGQDVPLKPRKAHVLPDYHSASDIERLLAEAERGLHGQGPEIKDRNFAFIAVMGFAGLRRGEALNLRVRDINFDQRLIRVRQGKGRKDRTVPMIERLVVPLRQQVKGKSSTAKVFGISPRQGYRVVVTLSQKCGLEGFRPHSLRHFYGTALMERGAHLRAVVEMMGHVSIETTMVYVGISPHHLRRTADLLDSPLNASNGAADSRVSLDEHPVAPRAGDIQFAS